MAVSMRQKKISLVVPCYNEEQCINLFYNEIIKIIDSMPQINFEIICVDDGSTDNTLSKLIELSKTDHRLHIVELSRNFGKESALTAGIEEADSDAIIPMDADFQDPPELIPTLINEWVNGADVVLARRTDRSSDSFLKCKTAELFYCIHNKLASIKIPENVGDFRLMDRMVVDALKKLPEQQRFMKGLFAWVGFKTVIVDYKRNERACGNTKFSGWKLWNLALEAITSFSLLPLKVWSYLGFIGALVSLMYGLFIFFKTLMLGIDIPGYASLIVVFLFFGSVQMIGIGVLGEYIGRIYMESKRRPVYLIKKRHGVKK